MEASWLAPFRIVKSVFSLAGARSSLELFALANGLAVENAIALK